MKRLLAIFLSISLMLTMTVGIVYGADKNSVPSIPDPLAPGSIALDLFEHHEAEATQESAQISKVALGPVESMVQSYTRTDGSFRLSEESRFYIDSRILPSDELFNTVRLIDSQFASKGIPSDEAIPIVYGARTFAKPGDIVIRCGVDEKSVTGYADSSEAYELEVGDIAMVTASGTDGVYYGLLTMMELAIQNGIEDASSTIPACEISDGPDLKERTICLDCARKYFSKDWIENLIRRASMQRYNTIELHFSEAEGIRIESNVFPWLTAGNKSLTREEVIEIINTARKYHMDVIPSVDYPGHSQYLVQQYAKYVEKHPDFSFEYDGVTYDKSISGFSSIANHYSYNGETKEADYIGFDVTKPHAVAFTDALLDDYASFFRSQGCDRINISGDELLGWYTFTLGGKLFNYENRWEALEHWDDYAEKQLGIKNGSASDTFINYLNTTASRLEEQGYTVRVFNDEINLNDNQHIKLNPSIEVNFWSGSSAPAKIYAEEGHRLHNNVSSWDFYVVKNKGGDIMTTDFASVNTVNIYNNWNPRSFSSNPNKVRTISNDQFAGGYFHIWCDHPDYKDSQTIWNETNDLTWVNSTKMWNPEITDHLEYKSFEGFVDKIGNFPGYAGTSNKTAKLAEASNLKPGTAWWKKILSYIGIY